MITKFPPRDSVYKRELLGYFYLTMKEYTKTRTPGLLGVLFVIHQYLNLKVNQKESLHQSLESLIL